MKTTTNKSPWSQQWGKKLVPNHHKMENAGEKQGQGGGSIPVKMVTLDAQAE